MEISTLLFIFIGLLLLVAFIVVFNMKRGQSAEGKYVNIPVQQPTNIVYDSTVVFDLFKMRIENGIERSLEHARELEGKLVVENTGISEFEYDAMTKKAHLKTELQFVGNYITHYCDEKKYKNLSFAKNFINEACKLLGHKDAVFSKLYYYLQKLISMLDTNEDISKIVDAVHSNLEEIVSIDSNDISISSIIHNIKELAEEIDAHQKHFSSKVVKLKVEAFTAVSDKCFDIQNEIEDSPEPWVPELFVWNSIIVQIKEKLKTAASELTESPDFEVAVFNTPKQIHARI